MNPAELHRQLNNLLQIGTIESVNTVDKTCRVQIGDLLTGELDMPAEIGRNFVRWQPLRVGTQVLLASSTWVPTRSGCQRTKLRPISAGISNSPVSKSPI